MDMRRVEANSVELEDFLALPQRIYPVAHRMQSADDERALITGTHPLSPDCEVQAYVGYQQGQVAIRGLLTIYPEDTTCYLGFFESVDDEELARQFLTALAELARQQGAKQIVGPVQASFWLGYRMQLSGTEDEPFTGEPHNPAYYPSLWEGAGFMLKERYVSNFYPKVTRQTRQAKLARRYQAFQDAGIEIKSPKKADWDQTSQAVFDLLNRLYQDFPAYRPISPSQFSVLFAPYRLLLDFSMVKLAYQKQRLIGFVITMPDYGAQVYQPMTWWRLVKLWWTKHRPQRYIILYLGVEPAYLGLGSALSYPIFTAARRRQAAAIGALIHQGTVTRHYAADLQGEQHTYGLYQLDL